MRAVAPGQAAVSARASAAVFTPAGRRSPIRVPLAEATNSKPTVGRAVSTSRQPRRSPTAAARQNASPPLGSTSAGTPTASQQLRRGPRAARAPRSSRAPTQPASSAPTTVAAIGARPSADAAAAWAMVWARWWAQPDNVPPGSSTRCRSHAGGVGGTGGWPSAAGAPGPAARAGASPARGSQALVVGEMADEIARVMGDVVVLLFEERTGQGARQWAGSAKQRSGEPAATYRA